jgi:hypothetical protein
MDAIKFPKQITKEDGPFNYNYIAVTSIPGIKLPSDQNDETTVYNFPELQSKAFLTNSCDRYFSHRDKNSALIYLMCTAFRGRKKYGKLSVYWHKLLVRLFGDKKMFNSRLNIETKFAAEKRSKLKKNIGSYLVYHASDSLLDPLNLYAASRVGRIGFGFDIFPAKKIRENHQYALNSTLTALSLALDGTNGSPDTHFIGDIIYLTGKNGLNIYSSTINAGSAGVITSAPPEVESLLKLNSYIPAMINDKRLETSVSLYIQSQKKGNDNLRSFIAAWSAFELIVNRFSKMVWPKWQILLEKTKIPDWNRDLKQLPIKDYYLRDKFFSIACVFDYNSVSEDTKIFIKINKMRNDFYHRLDLNEKDLPTSETQKLFRKYIKLGLTELQIDN